MILKKLFEPISIAGVEIKNRIVMSPMCTYFAAPDGSITERLISYYEERAKGGVGLIITGYTFIGDESSRDMGNQIGIHNDRFIAGLNFLVEQVHKYDTNIFAQLSYYGRKSSNLCKKNITKKEYFNKNNLINVEELSLKDIEFIVDLFGKAAKRAKLAGFDGVEIHALFPDILSRFMLKQTNKRSDKYGGNLENRMRIIKEIIESIRCYVGEDFPIGFRFGAGDNFYFMNGKEFTFSEAQKAAALLEDFGADYLNIFRVPLPIYTKQSYKGAEIVKQKVKIPVIIGGSIVEPLMAEEILFSNKADLVALGRALIADPEWPRKAKEGKYEEIRKCIRCNECIARVTQYQSLKCAINVNVGLESKMQITEAVVKKKVAIIGGGPAGMEAALTLALRGHKVTLFEKEPILGGKLIPGSRPVFKRDIKNLIEWFNKRLKEMPIELILGREVTTEMIVKNNFDVVIIATGTKTKSINIPIEKGVRTYTAIEVLNNFQRKEIGKNIIVIGGGVTGCEVAIFIANMKKKVTLLEAREEILADEKTEFNKIELMRMLKQAKVKIYTGVKLKKLTKRGVFFLNKDKEVFLPADSIIVAVGNESNRELFEKLKGKISEIYCIGDCKFPRKIYHAIHEGFEIGLLI